MHQVTSIRRVALAAVLAIAASLTVLTLVFAAQASAASSTFNVNPLTGNDANPATGTAPLKTLGKALSLAHAGDTVQLAPGDYGAGFNGDVFPAGGLTVPSGVTISGSLTASGNVPISRLQGTGGGVALRLAGSATVRNLFVGGPRGFAVGLFAKQGTQTLSKVFVATPPSASAVVVDGIPVAGGIVLRGTAAADVTGGTIFAKGVPGVALGDQARLALHHGTVSIVNVAQADGVRAEGASRFTLDGGTITGGGPNCGLDATGIAVHDAAQATLVQGGDLVNVPGFGILAHATAKVTITGSTISREATAGCKGRPSVALKDSTTLATTDATIESSGGQDVDGIVSNNSATLSLLRTTVSGFTGNAIDLNRDEHLTIQGGTIDHNGTGIDARILGDGTTVVHSPHIKITNATLSGNGIGAELEQPIFKMRGTRVDSNGTGLEVIGPVGGIAVGDNCASQCVNLGFEGDPGNNTFTNNTDTGVRFRPNDGRTPSAIVADGNVWNANTQGSDGSGRYTTPLLLRAVVPDPRNSGRNFELPNGSNTFIDLAGNPIGRARVSPQVLLVAAGRPAHLALSWKHPHSWTELRSVQLRAYRGTALAGTVTVRPHGERVTASGAIKLAAGSRVTHRGKTVTARLVFALPTSLAGKRLRLAVKATDRRGHTQLESAGLIRVTN